MRASVVLCLLCVCVGGSSVREQNGLDASRVPRGFAGEWAESLTGGDGTGTQEGFESLLLGSGKAGKLRGGGLGDMNFAGRPKVVLDGQALQVTVEWKHVKFTAKGDWVGAFPCHIGEDEATCSPINRYPMQFKEVPPKSNDGTFPFTVLARPGVIGYRFAYVSASVAPYPEVQAVSRILIIPEAMLARPTQVRLSLVDQSSLADQEESSKASSVAIRFIWALSPAIWSSHNISDFVVRVGKSETQRIIDAPALQSYTYDQKDLCEQGILPASSVGWVQPGLQIEAIAYGLDYDTKYFYSIENVKTDQVWGLWSFKTLPAVGQPVKMAVFGDMGQSMDAVDGSRQHSWDYNGKGEISAPNTTKLVQHMLDEYDATLVNHIGDISYATGALGLWDTWLMDVEKVSSRVAYMVAIGNHEMGWSKSAVPGTDSQGECGVPYSAFFPFASQTYSIPDKVSEKPIHSRAWEQPWYSYDAGLAHITVMSTEHEFGQGSPQLEWLERDLEKVDRKKTPWLLFMGHRPMYVSSTFEGDHDALAQTLQSEVQPLLVKYKVDIAFWGHHHSYQRSRDIQGVRHFVVGSAGAKFSPIAKDGDPHFDFVNNDTWGVILLDLVNSTAAQVKFFDNKFFTVLDQDLIIRHLK